MTSPQTNFALIGRSFASDAFEPWIQIARSTRERRRLDVVRAGTWQSTTAPRDPVSRR